ncbi:hypothetical protein HMPREF9582_00208 [Cutibacterium acnes HL060PA1]|nr:hypothetical protein HMPREF9577_00870 [Cutibacterium acnes HL110PA3]EFT66069.1 hypothetical protein HMPREF9582_00208 [Cutibacterium acnes HL060PA1]
MVLRPEVAMIAATANVSSLCDFIRTVSLVSSYVLALIVLVIR